MKKLTNVVVQLSLLLLHISSLRGLEFSSNRVGKVLSPGVRFDTLHPLKNLSVALESCICSEGPRLIEARAEVVSCAKFSLLAGEGSAGEKE